MVLSSGDFWLIVIISKQVRFSSWKPIRTFHLNHLDVFHNATHSLIIHVIDLHQNQTLHHPSILAPPPPSLTLWVRRPFARLFVRVLCVLISGRDINCCEWMCDCMYVWMLVSLWVFWACACVHLKTLGKKAHWLLELEKPFL